MKDAHRTKKIMIIAIILAVLAFLIYGFLFLDIKNQNEQISSLVNDANSLSDKDQSLQATKDSLAQNKDLITQLDTYFIPSDGVVGFISTLEDLGKQSGVTVVLSTVGTEPDPTFKNKSEEALSLHIDTTGSWQDTVYFLSALEDLPYNVNISQASLGLTGAADQILFDPNPNALAQTRVSVKGESWQGSFDLTVLKLI